MNDTFFGGFVELANGFQDDFFRFGSTLCKGCACLIDSSTRSPAQIAVVDAAFFVLLISFDLRLNVSQGISCLS